MPYGLQSHFGEANGNGALGVDKCRELAALGITHCRIDAQYCSVETMHAMVAEVVEAGMHPLVIVASLEMAQAVPNGVAMEWRNEPDGDDYANGDMRPEDYRRELDRFCEVAAAKGSPSYGLSLSNTSHDAITWGNKVRDAGGGWPATLTGISIHSYRKGSRVDEPNDHFESRANEVDRWVRALAQGKDVILTEFGHSLADENQAAANIAWEWDFWNSRGITPYLYQIWEGDAPGDHWGLYRQDWSLKEAIAATIPKPPPPEPEPVPEPEPFPVPTAAVDLTSWPRRGATIAASLLDTRWDFHTWAAMLGGIFHGRSLTQVNVLSALWPESAPHMQHPFIQEADGRWNLAKPNLTFYSRLEQYVEAMNQQGVVVQLCFLELYSWSKRKSGMPFDKALSPVCHNVNGVNWLSTNTAEDDATLASLPDAFLTELVERVCTVVKGAAVAVVPFNEGPEKPIHFKIAEIVKRVDPNMRVVVNRNEDSPGQYMNMKVGQGLIDMIAFHGWDDLGFLTKDFRDEPNSRPRNFDEFFRMQSHDGREMDIDFSRVICSSDGSRSSDDPIDTYNKPELIKVFQFIADKGGNCEHQERAKMSPGARLDMVDQPFLKEIADL